jgi:cytosine/adenosine deaminase-related metal-dependent hydrolase
MGKKTEKMKILVANWILVCNDNFDIIKNGAIVFDKQIIEIGSKHDIQKKYPTLTPKLCGKNSVIMAGFVNSHIHLEFCANKTTLKYGNFVKWLFSVIANRDELIQKITPELISIELNKMLQSGTTTIGAISSYGFDLISCVKSPINVVYFAEVLGSKANMIDTLFLDFKERLKSAKTHKSDNFIPAIAIHSPYSTHPILIREVLKIAQKENLAVTTHFQESIAENNWLNYSSGEFKEFFVNILNQYQSLQRPSEFLSQFENIKNLSFTHCVQANNKELAQIKKLNATIIHCPNSNRLLNNSILNFNFLDGISLAIGTDGLSSNYTLNMFEELRNAFFMHTNFEPNQLAIKLLLASTNGGAKAFGLNKGSLTKGKDADIICFNLPDEIHQKQDLAVAIILHISKVKQTYIKGEQIEFFS